jgi:pimeloyl-ACP methyl ester carboxylesterase
LPKERVNQTTIHYEIEGSGEAIVFIPGLGANLSMYKPQVEYFKHSNTVISIDLRGNGESGVLTTQCKDIKLLLEKLDIHSAIFVGVSYGGVICQLFTKLFSSIVKKLVIVDSFCTTKPKSLKMFGIMIGAYMVGAYYLPTKFLTNSIKSTYAKWPLALEEMEKVVTNMRKKEVVKQRLAINRINYTDFIAEFNMPSLVLVGNHTNIGIDMSKQIAERLPNCRFEIIENAFDPSNLCQPEIFNRKLDYFINEDSTNPTD